MRVVHYVSSPEFRDVAICGVKDPGHNADWIQGVTCQRCLAILANPLTKKSRKYIEWNPYAE